MLNVSNLEDNHIVLEDGSLMEVIVACGTTAH